MNQNVEFKTLYRNIVSYAPNDDQPCGQTIQDPGALLLLYAKIQLPFDENGNGQRTYHIPPYAPNFERETVIAVFQGTRFTTGYEVEITDIVETESNVLVKSKLSEPTDTLAGLTLTSPTHIVVCKKIEKRVRFEWKISNTD